MANAIVILILVAVTGANIRFLIRAKKRGKKCIGCPYAGQCGKKTNETCQNDSDKK